MQRITFRTLLCATVVAFFALGRPAGAAPAARDVAELLVPVHAFAAAFNARGAYPDAAFTFDGAVLDDFPPYVWSGVDAPRRWYRALMGTTAAERRALAATHSRVTFRGAEFARIVDGRAYLVVPGTLTLVLQGKVQTQHGRWTLVEVRGPHGWRIASQAWAITDGFADD